MHVAYCLKSFSSSCKRWRVKKIRLFTVPSGKSSFSAISRYLNPETCIEKGTLYSLGNELTMRCISLSRNDFRYCRVLILAEGSDDKDYRSDLQKSDRVLLAIIIDEDVAHDGVHPSFKVSVGSIFIFVI